MTRDADEPDDSEPEDRSTRFFEKDGRGLIVDSSGAEGEPFDLGLDAI